MEERIIGQFEGEPGGPLLICIGGIHGNEPAGIQAIEEILSLLEKEKSAFPDFKYQGTFLGIKGNLEAIRQQKRFIDRDLNRMITRDFVQKIRLDPGPSQVREERECIELLDLIFSAIQASKPSLTLILDLHTTTASGGVFSIAAEDEISLKLATGLHVPVILGIASGLQGTTLEYFNQPDQDVYCVVFEAGQHLDPQSVDRTVSAVINCMRSVGAVDPNHVDHRHDGLLISLSADLPKVTRLIYHYKIQPGEHFEMHAGFKNFDPIRTGDLLAENEHGPIHSPHDGLILMPKYQPLGDDGFFLVEAVEPH